MNDPRDVIIKPVVSEKSYGLMETGVYTFVVHPSANRVEIREAVEDIFGVKVAKVNTLNRKGKRKRNRRNFGFGSRPDLCSSSPKSISVEGRVSASIRVLIFSSVYLFSRALVEATQSEGMTRWKSRMYASLAVNSTQLSAVKPAQSRSATPITAAVSSNGSADRGSDALRPPLASPSST